MITILMPAVLVLVLVMAMALVITQCRILGYPFYKAAVAAAGSTATILDPVLRTAVTTLTIRGNSRVTRIHSVTLNSDAPGLGSYGTVRVGNDGIARYDFTILPSLDADLATQPVHLAAMNDLGGFEVSEQEQIVITLYDPGAAENMSGVLYIQDGEQPLPLKKGRPMTLFFPGTNDAATAISTTGGDKPSVKLEENYLYGVMGATVRPEDKVVEALVLADGNGNTATFAGAGKVLFPEFAMVFTGAQWNQGTVSLFVQVQAATKVECNVLLIEMPGNIRTGIEKPISVQPISFPGQPSLPGAVAGGGGMSGGAMRRM